MALGVFRDVACEKSSELALDASVTLTHIQPVEFFNVLNGGNMAQPNDSRTDRKAELRAALALAGKTIGDFATECGVSRNHFDEVMNGERASGRIDALVDATIHDFRVEIARRQLATATFAKAG